MTGKEKCALLKAMRKEITEANGIVYLTSECTFQGECLGYCPKCDAEARYLDSELNRLAKEDREIKVSGLAYQKFLATAEATTTSKESKTDDELMIEGHADYLEEKVLGMKVEELDFSSRTLNDRIIWRCIFEYRLFGIFAILTLTVIHTFQYCSRHTFTIARRNFRCDECGF